ncbi:glycosyltransferase [Candidatus Bipolaricaulota bacterium]
MEAIGIEKYVGVVDGQMLADIQRAARSIYGLRVLHVNSVFQGGGVAGMLNSLIPLMNDVGVNADWNLLYGDPDVFEITKKLHNGIQGEGVELTAQDLEAYLSLNRTFALYSPIIHDVVIVHDPQPLPMIRYRRRENPWVWRCHIDMSNPNQHVLDTLRPFIMRYDAVVVSSESYKQPDWFMDTHIAPPAIDPFAELNRELSEDEINAKLAEYDIDQTKPILTQVSRFDKWKDPEGVLEVFKRVRQDVDCSLVLLGNMAADDPEGPVIFQAITATAAAMDDVQLITQNDPVLVNALQRRASVVLQLSKREGFGLTVSEALWKGTPVLATRVGGIPLQVKDSKMGFLVEPEAYDDAAERVLKLLKDPDLCAEFGKAGREHVRGRFLIPRLLLDWLNVLKGLG